jgi:hypothetical protein
LRRLNIIYLYSIPKVNEITKAISKLSDEELSWNNESYILANIFDAIQQLTFLTESMNTPKEKPRPKRPKPHPRPGEKKPSRPRPGDWFPGKTIVSK